MTSASVKAMQGMYGRLIDKAIAEARRVLGIEVIRVVAKCPRCGRRHRLELTALTRPAGELTLHSACARTGEPVLGRLVRATERRREKWPEGKIEYEFI